MICDSVTVRAPSDSEICNSGSSVTVCVSACGFWTTVRISRGSRVSRNRSVCSRKENVRQNGGRVDTEFIETRSQGFR